MCWSKGDPEPQETTTPRRQMDKIIRCPTDYANCAESNQTYCDNGGLCCLFGAGTRLCVCPPTFHGIFCQNRVYIFDTSRLIMERTKVIAAFSAVLGVFVIALFLVLIAFQIKYYRYRKKRILTDGHEMNVIPKPPGSGSRINQPGYSWRQSVRRSSKAIQKLQGPSSRSVPDDLFKMGVTIALFNFKADELKNKGREEKGGGVGPDTLGRCFSAGAGDRGEGGDSTVGSGPKATHSPTGADNGQERVPLTRRTEDAEGK